MTEQTTATHDYATKQVLGRDLTGDHVLVGESGGLSALFSAPTSGYTRTSMIVDTEHGMLIVDPGHSYDVLDAAPATPTPWVLVIDHAFGNNVTQHASEDDAYEELWAFVDLWWEKETRLSRDAMPAAHRGAIYAYFDQVTDETYTITRVGENVEKPTI